MFTSGSVSKPYTCYTFTTLPVFQEVIIIITCIRYVNNILIIYASFVNISHVFLALIFTTTTKVCFKKRLSKLSLMHFPWAMLYTGQVAYYGTTNKPTFARVSRNLLHLCLNNLPLILVLQCTGWAEDNRIINVLTVYR